jgi:gliding motility-associated-like protein
MSVQFMNTSTSQNGTITVYDWDFTSNGTDDNVSENPSNNYAAAGLYLVTLQVQSNYGCQNTIKKPVRVNPTPVADFAVAQQKGCSYNMCVGMINNSTMQGGSIASWLWNFGDNTTSSQNSPVHCFKSGTFNVSLTVVSDSGCTSTTTINNAITVYPSPVAGFMYTPESVDIIDPTVTIENQAEGATGYIYYLSDGYVVAGHPNFTHTFTSDVPQNYTVLQIVTNSFGCRDSITHDIIINPGYTFYIPNTFTPNGDGLNEVFKGVGIGITSYTIMIFDRWGEMIFQSNSLDQGWDGTFKGKGGNVVQEGVYVWKVQLRDEKNNEHDFDGTVSVIK